MKVCTKCKVEKEVINFSKHKLRKNGINNWCKMCDKEYRLKNKDKIKQMSLKNKDYYKNYREKNKLLKTEYDKNYREKNKEKLKIKNKEYRKNNIEKLKIKNNEYVKNRYKIDELFKFRSNVKNNIRFCFKRGKNQFSKGAKTEVILGCTIEFFKEYIESLFDKQMNFKNYGKWHLDHIIPISNATTEDEIIKLCHYTNYQPLWAKDNLSKSNKIIQKQLKLI
jgi:hypothetical protein